MKHIGLKIGGLLALVLATSFNARSIDNPQALFEQGNQHYQKKQYKNALQCYDSLANSGYVSDNLYFNLGNAAYKVKNWPKAILYYERAKKLSGRNPDIEHNLKLASQKIPDDVTRENRLLVAEWWETVLYYFSASGWAVCTVILLWVACGGLALRLLGSPSWLKKAGLVLTLSGLLLFIPCLLITKERYGILHKSNEAIVWETSVYVKSAPDEESEDRFIIHEGLKVTLIDEVGDWRQIRLPDGKQGWIRESVYKVI